jgi:hypothetical protein
MSHTRDNGLTVPTFSVEAPAADAHAVKIPRLKDVAEAIVVSVLLLALIAVFAVVIWSSRPVGSEPGSRRGR